MKNLKKVLSLVLALAMALSLMTVAFAKEASDYADYDEVNYAEAVDVMTAAGIFDGMGGSFNPDGNLTREQAAKIITYMVMGQANADKLTTTIAPYDDVAAGRWSAGAIAWCTEQGILSGMGHNKFAPTDNVTGLQFAKMLLVALGYDAEIEEMVGDTWAINTSTLAIAVGLDDNMEEVPMSGDLTREQACLMAFNAMQTPLVQYDSKGTTIEVNGATVTFGAREAEYVTTTRANEQTISSETLSNSANYTVEFAEKYCRDLTLSGDTDAFARPAHTWRYDKELIGTYKNTPDLTYTSGVELGTIYADLGLTEETDILDQYVDGYEIPAADLQTLERRSDTDLAESGNGVLTEVWFEKNDDGDVVELLITNVNTYVADINAVQNDGKDNRSITLAAKSDPVYGSLNNKFETQDFAAGDLVTYTAAYNDNAKRYEIQTVEALENPATGILTEWNGKIVSGSVGTSEDDFTVGGTTYNYSLYHAVDDEDGAPAQIWNDFDVDESELNVYLDEYGYAIYVSGVEGTTNYAAVIGVGSTNPYGSKTQGVTLMLADGSIVEVQAKMADGQNWTNLSYDGSNENLVDDAYGDIVTYKVDDNNVYELTVAGTGTNPNFTGHGNSTTNDDYLNANYEIQFVNGRSQFVLNDGNDGTVEDTLFATEDTIFFVGTDLTDLSYEVYVGYENMPSTATDVTANAFAYVTNDEYSQQLDAVYLVVDHLAGISAVDTYFVKEAKETITSNSTGSYYTLPAIVEGEKTEVKVSITCSEVDDNENEYGLFAITNVVMDENGIITSFTDVTNTTTFSASAGTLNNTMSGTVGTVRASSGVLGIGASGDKDHAEYFAYGSDTVAYYVDKDYEDINIINVASIANDTNDYVYAIRDDDVNSYKKLDAVVIVEQEDSSVVTHTVTITGANSNAWVNKVDGTHYANQTSITVEDGKDFQFKLDPLAGKQVASVKVGSTELTPDANGVYTVSNVTGNITVNVTCGNILSLSVKNTAASGITVQVGDNAPEAVAGSSATTTGTYNVTNGQVVNVTVVYGNASGTPTLTATNATAIPVNTVAGSVTYQVWIDSNASTSVELQFNIA